MGSITRDEKKRLKALEKNLGYRFKEISLLKHALMHKSYANEQKLGSLAHNERLEYLGDAVLELTISHLLMERFVEDPEGSLSKWRAAIVNAEELAKVARKIELGNYLYLGKGEDQTGGRDKSSLLSDAFEAVLGAIYRDRGFSKSFDVIRKHFYEMIEQVGEEGFVKDYKTRLQEVVQGRFKTVPRYRLISSQGPDHRKTFEIHLYVNEELWSKGQGASKKAAEQEAARIALERVE